MIAQKGAGLADDDGRYAFPHGGTAERRRLDPLATRLAFIGVWGRRAGPPTSARPIRPATPGTAN